MTFVDPATGALRVATGSDDETIRVWDAETGGVLLVIDVGSGVWALAFFVDPATGARGLLVEQCAADGLATCASSTRSRAARRCS